MWKIAIDQVITMSIPNDWNNVIEKWAPFIALPSTIETHQIANVISQREMKKFTARYSRKIYKIAFISEHFMFQDGKSNKIH